MQPWLKMYLVALNVMAQAESESLGVLVILMVPAGSSAHAKLAVLQMDKCGM